MPEEPLQEQNMRQKKIALAGSEHAPVILELLKDCMGNNPLVTKTQWGTIVNAITLDVQGELLKRMANYIEEIRRGCLIE